jgi:hypothetical protein
MSMRLVGAPGFEPGVTESKSVALPLGHAPAGQGRTIGGKPLAPQPAPIAETGLTGEAVPWLDPGRFIAPAGFPGGRFVFEDVRRSPSPSGEGGARARSAREDEGRALRERQHLQTPVHAEKRPLISAVPREMVPEVRRRERSERLKR